MKMSTHVLLRLNLALAISLAGLPIGSAVAYARSADTGDTYTSAANRTELKIAQMSRVTGQLAIVNGTIQLTEKATGRTYRIDDQNGEAQKAYNAGNRMVSIEGTNRGNGTLIAETVDTL